ncbi:MAG: class I SAM-dependent DNA methyltransferase [Peptococcales bacterium]|jgi:ubiquinone/menaquinone biosynthesis C-methylase UbiE
MAYTNLAGIYDQLMEDVDYNRWVNYLVKHIETNKAPGKVLLDLGCGTGSIAVLLAKQGYRVIGIDISLEMLSQAEQKAREAKVDIFFCQQDIEELTLGYQVDIVIATFDTFNYITTYKGLENIFQRVHTILKPHGLLIFDLNTPYKLKEVLGENTYTYNTEELVYIWENYYEKQTKICQMDLTFFALEPKTGKYLRFNETHLERAYTEKEIEAMLIDKGFNLLGIYGELEFSPPKENEERIFFVAKKHSETVEK